MIIRIIGNLAAAYLIYSTLKIFYKWFFGPHDCIGYPNNFRFGCPLCKKHWTWYGKRK